MIRLEHVTKCYGFGRHRKYVLRELNAVFEPQRNYVVFGLRHSGKSSLLGALAGTLSLSGGSVERIGSVSPVIGSPAILANARTAAALIEIYAALYQVDQERYGAFVQEYGAIPNRLLNTPVTKLSPEVRSSLAYALTYGIPADWYLFDGFVGPSGDSALAKWCAAVFMHRKETSNTVYVTSSTRNAHRYGDAGGVLHDGHLKLFQSLEEAVEIFQHIQSGVGPATAGTVKRSVAATRGRSNDTLRARELAAEGDTASAIALLKASAAHGVTSVDSSYLLARLCELRGDWAGAVAAALSVLALSSAHRGALVIAARSREKLDDLDGALPFWKALADGTTRSADYLPLVRNHIKQRNWHAALEAIDGARALDAADPSLMTLRLRALLELRRFAQFREELLPLAVINWEAALGILSPNVHRLDLDALSGTIKALDVLGLIRLMDDATQQRMLGALDRYARATSVAEQGALIGELKRTLSNGEVR